MEKEIRISNHLNEIVVLASFIEELGEELSLPAETVKKFNCLFTSFNALPK